MYFARASLYLLWKSLPERTGLGCQIGTEEGSKRDIFAHFAGGRTSNWNGFPAQFELCPPGRCALISPVSTRMEILIFVAVALVVAGPILAIMALVAIRRLEGDSLQLQIPQLTSRIYILEKRMLALEQAIRPAVSAESEPETIKPATGIPLHASADPVRVTASPSAPGEVEPTVAPPPALVSAGSGAVTGNLPANRAPNNASTSPAIGGIYVKSAAPQDLESRIAGNWFLRIGIVALLVALSSGLKWAFDNDWVGESGRIAIGILLGALMLPWSQWLLGKGYSYFSEGIAALGEATLFLSVWAGCQYYTLYSRDIGFAAMIVITVVMAALAIARDSERIAVLSLVGALLTPILASSGQDQQVVLFGYLSLLGAGALAIASKKDWKSLLPIAFFGTQIYFWGWYEEFFHRTSPLERTVVFATLFFFLYAALPIVKALGGLGPAELDIAMILLNAFAYSSALFILLWPADKWPLTLLFLALAAGHVAVARVIPSGEDNRPTLARLLYAGLALTFLTLAVPIRLEGKWITLSFSVEGAILVWTGFRAASNFLRQSGYLLLGISALRLLVLPPDGGPFLLNARFAAYLVMIACFGVALWAARTHERDLDVPERAEIGILLVAINVYALIALSWEFWDYFGKAGHGVDIALAQHVALSVLWTLYATVLLFLGVQNKSALLRWQSLSLFGLVVGKVFLYDLSFLDRGYRILSFFVLGAVLLGVSFSYTRKSARQRANS